MFIVIIIIIIIGMRYKNLRVPRWAFGAWGAWLGRGGRGSYGTESPVSSAKLGGGGNLMDMSMKQLMNMVGPKQI
jgi:hypothetical protein